MHHPYRPSGCRAGGVLPWHAAAPVAAQDSPIGGITWQVEDRFRFFSDAATFAPHEAAAAAFAAVEAPSDEFGRKKINGRWIGPVQFAERKLAAHAIANGHDGWAAQAFTAGKDPFTCWDPGHRRVRKACLEADAAGGGQAGSRLFPSHVTISARLDGAGAALFAGKQCAWFIHTGTDQDWRRVTEADCAGAAGLTAPVNAPFSLLAQVLDPASAGGVMTQVTAVYQEVKGRVIVGLGDSYASGEGNPDYPANYSKPKTLGGTHRPLPASGPHWLDPACHRSVYSHQQRIAMQLAAENRQSVVSFLGYACSGATIPDVMDASDTHVAHVEPVTRVSLRDAGVRKQADIVEAQAGWSQLDHALRDLCADEGAATATRPLKGCGNWRAKPDLVLMTAGGNDLGFANVVKWAVAGTAVGKVRFLSGAEKPETMLARANGKADLGACDNDRAGHQCRLSNRYASLAVAIENKLGLTDRSRVLTAPYPDPLTDAAGALCTAGPVNDGADSEHFVSTSDERLQRLNKALFAERTLTNAMKQAASRTGWTWSDAISWSGAFQGHGICASAGAKADAFRVIQVIRGKWDPVSPADMLAYAPRQRWFRTFNDSILMQFYVTRIDQLARNPRQPVDYHYQAGYSGYFHPTAEGQAVMADMLLNAARCKLFGGC
jgi:hypothetical protein